MNIVSVESLSKSYTDKPLCAQLSFGIEAGERIGLIGVNGSGKSTLLKMIAGLERPDEGTVTFRSGLTVEYLSQTPELNPAATVLDTLFQGDSPAVRVLLEYERVLSALVQSPTDTRLQTSLADLQLQMDAQQIWALEAHAKSILTRLGITDFGQPVGELSGGQRKRVAMACALIQSADVLILDEPTNHIDNETVVWLEEYLAKFSGALLLVTHDRYFLDRVVTRIFELEGGRLHSYTGNYGDYLEQKAAREETEIVREDRRQNLLRRELAWLRRGAKARSTKQKARIQRVEALAEDRPESRGGPLEIAVGSHRLGRRIMEINKVSKGFGEQTLIRDFSYTVLPGDRVGIIGPNGSGKSTLLNLIAGRLLPDAGEVVTGGTVRLAYYDQESGNMDPDQRVIDYIKEVAEVVGTPDGGTITAAQMLERFLFPVRAQYTPIAKLSGGERRRLYLLRTLMREPNVLLLDEPTNDLDIQTLTILEDYLDQFPGVVIAVSHDRYFLDRVVDHLFIVKGDGRVGRSVGGYSDYLEAQRLAVESVTDAAKAAATDAAQASDPTGADRTSGSGGAVLTPQAEEPRRRSLKFTFKEQQEFQGIEDEIAVLETKLAALGKMVDEAASDYTRLQALCLEQAEVEAQLNQKLERWAELTQLAEEIKEEKGNRQTGRQ